MKYKFYDLFVIAVTAKWQERSVDDCVYTDKDEAQAVADQWSYDNRCRGSKYEAKVISLREFESLMECVSVRDREAD
jgi:hypothetical protein